MPLRLSSAIVGTPTWRQSCGSSDASSSRSTAGGIQPGLRNDHEAEAIQRDLIEGGRLGEPKPFDFEASKVRKRSEFKQGRIESPCIRTEHRPPYCGDTVGLRVLC